MGSKRENGPKPSCFIESASRSPPGQSSGTFGVIFCSFGVNLVVFFGSWGFFGGAVGTFFGADGDLARQRCPKRRQPPIPLTILDPSWGPKPTKIDQKSMPRCIQIVHRFSDRFLIDFWSMLGSIWAPFLGHVGHHMEDRRNSKKH